MAYNAAGDVKVTAQDVHRWLQDLSTAASRRWWESRGVVLALMKADEIEIAVEWLRTDYAENPTLKIEDHGVYYRIDCEEGFTFELDEIDRRGVAPRDVYEEQFTSTEQVMP